MKKHLLLGLFVLCIAISPVFGQAIPYSGTPVINGVGQPIAGASVAISTANPCGTAPSYTNCQGQAQGLYSGSLPPSNLATLFSDVNETHSVSNPLTTDGFGNWFVYAAPTTYWATIYGNGIIPYVAPFSTSGGGGTNLLPTNNTFTGTNTFTQLTSVKNLNSVLFADQFSGATYDAQVTACITAVIAQGGGICDATGLQGSQTIAAEIDVGNISGIPVILKISNNLLANISITDGSSCGFGLYDNGKIQGLIGAPGSQHKAIITATNTTNADSMICVKPTTGVYVGVSGLQLYNPSGGTFAHGLLSAQGTFDGSAFENLDLDNYSSVGAWVENDCCGTVFRDDVFNGNSSSGAQPLKIVNLSGDPFTVAGVLFDNVSVDHPGSGLNNIVIKNTKSSNLSFGEITFHNVYMEGNLTDTTTPLVSIDSFPNTVWTGVTVNLRSPSSTQVPFSIVKTSLPGTSNYAFNLIGFHFLDSGTYPMEVLSDGSRSITVSSDSNGDLSSYLGGPASFSSWEFDGNNTLKATNSNAILDASTASQWKSPIAPGYAAVANGEFGYESTNNNWLFWVNGANHFMVPLAAGFNTGDCAQPTNSGGTWFLADTGSPCGSGGSGATLQTNTVNNTSQVLLNFTNTSGAGGITFSNPSGGVESATLNNTTTTVNSQSCALGGSCTIPHQTGGVNNTSQAGINFITSTVNATGLTATHSNPATNQEKVEITGTCNPTSGCTGIDSHTSTGVAQVASGTWSVSTALANGTTATTQTAGDNTTKLATDAFVLANAVSNPMTTPGDMIVATTSGVPARLAVNTDTVAQVPTSVSGATSFQYSGVPINAQTGTSYTINKTDRASFVSFSNASPVAVTLPQAGSTGFANNFVFVACDIGAGTATITPTTSTISYSNGSTYTSGATSVSISTGGCIYIYTDNTNYFGIQFGTPASGANVNLSNITSPNINTSLLAQAGVDLGSTTKPFRNLFLFGSGTYGTTSGEFTSTPTAARTWTVPDASFTFAGTNLAETFSALQTFGANISIGGVTAAGATGTSNVVFSNSPTLVTPALGTPSAINLTNAASASLPGAAIANNGVTATQLAVQYSKGSCTELWGGSGSSFALTAGDDAISNNSCYNDSGVTRTITAVKCRSDNASNTTTVNPTFGSAGTGTTILSGALTCGSSLAYSSTGTVSNASWTTGTGINPVMGGTLTGTSIAVIVEYTY